MTLEDEDESIVLPVRLCRTMACSPWSDGKYLYIGYTHWTENGFAIPSSQQAGSVPLYRPTVCNLHREPET